MGHESHLGGVRIFVFISKWLARVARNFSLFSKKCSCRVVDTSQGLWPECAAHKGIEVTHIGRHMQSFAHKPARSCSDCILVHSKVAHSQSRNPALALWRRGNTRRFDAEIVFVEL